MDELYLGIETSCDDTSCAIYSPDRGVIVNRTAAQLDHERYGGVVPEIASRSHVKTLLPLYELVMKEAETRLEDLAGIGVTNGPGLTGSLLVGLSFAKALSYGSGVPLVGIHHLEGHILANALNVGFETPAIVLVVSGGHTQLIFTECIGRYRFLGGTRDDAAGEAFDKIGKLLGLPFPGGPALEREARGGRRDAFDFPRGLRHSQECDFSFSGLKTAVRLKVESLGALSPEVVRDVSASAQEAIVDSLVEKSLLAVRMLAPPHGGAESHGCAPARFYIAGGVAANGRLREVMTERLSPEGVTVRWPRTEYCTDNAAMIACAAFHHISSGRRDGLELNTFPRGDLVSWAS
ncbi:MAG TPA: tRNA (adenosine(37)-N6)-threonylcarbamoyltransferase complex transferase subunit TsaD [Patescibacteria group bacterium]|nr:tRNA (adenosine(37)-N6)-threonylcarbamoyltransferase complex transferase subunit TsaD [Patescibacteria group bacterium]